MNCSVLQGRQLYQAAGGAGRGDRQHAPPPSVSTGSFTEGVWVASWSLVLPFGQSVKAPSLVSNPFDVCHHLNRGCATYRCTISVSQNTNDIKKDCDHVKSF